MPPTSWPRHPRRRSTWPSFYIQKNSLVPKAFAMKESPLLDHPQHLFIGEGLLLMKEKVKAGAIFKFLPEYLSKIFALAQRNVNFGKIYVPYQRRHGGPPADRRDSIRTPLEVKQRGRWIADLSMKRYEAAARLQKEEALAGPPTSSDSPQPPNSPSNSQRAVPLDRTVPHRAQTHQTQ